MSSKKYFESNSISMIVRIIIVISMLFCISPMIFAQADWENRTPASQPSLRKNFALSQGPGGYVYLYGGWEGSTDYYDLYRWTGSEWVMEFASDASGSGITSPTANSEMKMAYDSVNNTLIMLNGVYYDGSSNVDVNETWIYDGSAWSNVTATAVQPVFRKEFALSTGPDGYIYLYGGWEGTTNYYNVYRWSGSAWVDVTPASAPTHPTANAEMLMARDSVNNNLVFYRGYYYTTEKVQVNETWTSNGTAWVNRSPATQPTFPRDRMAMSTGPGGDVFVYGGDYNDTTPANNDVEYFDLWKWNVSTWQSVTPATTPTACSRTSMAYDSVNNEMVLFGGEHYAGGNTTRVNETWVYSLGLASLNVSCTGGVGSFTIDGPAEFNGGSDYTGSSYNAAVPPGSYTVTYNGVSGYVVEVDSATFPDTNPTSFSILAGTSHSIVGNYFTVNNTVTVNNATGGSTDKDGANVIAHRGSITITPSASTGYHFTGWSGDASGSANPLTISDITTNLSITPQFTVNQYTVTVNSTAGGSTNRDGANFVNHNGTLTITPTATTGYHFTGWSGNASGSTNPLTVTVTSNMTITANFGLNEYTVTVNSSTGGTTDRDGTNTVIHDGQLTITPTDGTGHHFENWSGDASGSTNPLTVTVTSNMTITANFAVNEYTVTVNSSAGGTTDRDGTNTVIHDGQLTITPTDGTGHHFDNWSGDATGSTNPLTVTVTSDMTIDANFAVNEYTVTVNSSTGGTTDRDGTNTVIHDGQLTITPTDGTGHHFDNWSGDASGSTNPLTVTVTSDMTIDANFAINQYTVTVNTAAHGSTDRDGSNSVNYDNSITITATADSGYRLHHWVGDASGSANPFTINNVTVDMDVTPVFEAVYTVTFNPGAHGTISGSANQPVFSGQDCSAVELINIESGWEFSNWTGTGGFTSTSANPVTVTNVNADMIITANFTPQTGSLTVTIPNAAEVGGNHIAQWRRVGTSVWFDSGATENGVSVPASPVVIEYSPVNNWNKPANTTGVAITNGGNTSVISDPYVKTIFEGWLVVEILPEDAVNRGARWRVDGGVWRNNGSTSDGLSVGTHFLEFFAIPGWTTPQARNVEIQDGNKTNVEVTYVQVIGQQPVIHYFTVDPEVAGEGDPVTLAWDVRDADEISIDNSIGDVAAKGQMKTILQETTSFTLTSSNTNGESKASITASKVEEAVVNWFYSSNPAGKPCSLGSDAKLYWSITGAESAGIDTNGDGEIDVEVNPEGGELTVTPEEDGSEYHLYVFNAVSSKSVLVSVVVTSLPEIKSFEVNHSSVLKGNKVKFSWDVNGADTITIEPAPGNVEESSVEFAPEVGGVYTLTAENISGKVTCEIKIELKEAKKAPDLEVTFSKLLSRPSVSGYQAGEPVIVKASITNKGDRAARKFYLGLAVKGNSNALATKKIARLAAGATRVIQLQFVPAKAGQLPLLLEVDSGHVIAELNEKNNTAEQVITVSKAAGVDLLITEVDVRKAEGGAPVGAVRISFSIANGGMVSSDSFQYRVFLSNRNKTAAAVKSFVLSEDHVQKIKSNKRVNITLNALLPKYLQKNFYVIIMADIHDAVEETNNANNIFIRKFRLKNIK